MNPEDKVYLINLCNRTDRLNSSLDVLKTRAGFSSVERVPALKKSNLPFFDKKLLSNSERGCFQSHIETWKKIIKSDRDYAFVFEDDVMLEKSHNPDDFSILRTFLETSFEQIDMINLCLNIKGESDIIDGIGYFPLEEHMYSTITQKSKTLTFFPHKSTMFGIGSYVITKHGAAKLLEMIYLNESNINTPIDTYIFNHREYLNVFLVNKNLFYQDRTLGSDINPLLN